MSELINPQNLTLSQQQLSWLLPYLIVTGGGMLALIVGVMQSLNRNMAAWGASLLTVAAALWAVTRVWGEPGAILFNGMIAADYYSSFFHVILLGATGLVLLASYPYLEKEGIHHAEYYPLALFACLGMMLLASALDLITLFIALELMSIAVYVLVGFRRADRKSNEAALKYFVLGSAASAILLYGVALVYGATGTMNLTQLAAFIKGHPETNMLLVLGLILMMSGFLFKVATVPFHMWMPDVYEGAPTTITSFMTTGIKAASFAAFVRFFMSIGYSDPVTTFLGHGFHHVLWVSAVLTMFLGNVIALTQKNIKRMLAYSSIAHSGYILVGLIGAGKSEFAYSSIVLYLAAYVVMNLGAFTIVGILSEKGDTRTNVEDFAGMGFKRPALGAAMAVFMLSMAGIPPTAGFAGKYLLFSSAVQAGEIPLVIIAVLCSAISAYYYLRVIVFMYMRESEREVRFTIPLSAALVVIVATVATVQFGLFPTMLIEAAKKAIATI